MGKLDTVLTLDLDSVKKMFESNQKKWIESAEVLEKEKEEFEDKLKNFMDQQKQLMKTIFKSKHLVPKKFEFKTKKLPLFGV